MLTEPDVCGAMNSGLRCDRERGHTGAHRSYQDQIDEPMFWVDPPPENRPIVSRLMSARSLLVRYGLLSPAENTRIMLRIVALSDRLKDASKVPADGH